MPIFPGLGQEIFPACPDTLEHLSLQPFLTRLTPFSLKKHQENLTLKTVFWTNFKQFPHFLPSPLIFGYRSLSKLD